jgi:hypothetical protein
MEPELAGRPGDGRVTAGCVCAHSVGAVDEFAYFMIRVRRKAGKGAQGSPLAGVIERLGSGQKCAFEDATELIRLVNTWSLPAESAGQVRDDVAVEGE